MILGILCKNDVSSKFAVHQKKKKDFVVATGETHSVQEFCEIAFKHAGMELVWEGTGMDMVGFL